MKASACLDFRELIRNSGFSGHENNLAPGIDTGDAGRAVKKHGKQG